MVSIVDVIIQLYFRYNINPQLKCRLRNLSKLKKKKKKSLKIYKNAHFIEVKFTYTQNLKSRKITWAGLE